MKEKTVAWLVVVTIILALPALVSAQSQPPGNAVFKGQATLDGAPAPDGTPLSAWIDGKVAAFATVRDGLFDFNITEPPGETYGGKTVAFVIGGFTAAETGVWESDGESELQLTAQGKLLASPQQFPDTTAVPLAGVPGPMGPKGDTGPPGPQGDHGDSDPASIYGFIGLIVAVVALVAAAGAIVVSGRRG